MRRLGIEEILDIDTYETVRDAYREKVIEHKRPRRVGVGHQVTLVFEDRETLRYQIQEMTRIEQIRDPEKVQGELDAYNDLVPGEGELSATLFVEIPELDKVRSELDRLVGIDEHVSLLLGSGETAERIPARFDPKQMEEDRISAVQYIRFLLDPAHVSRLASEEPARIAIDHPNYAHETPLSPEARASLLRDLRDEPVVLLDVERIPRVDPSADAVLSEDDGVRVLAPARAAGGDHRIVELCGPEPVALEEVADESLLRLLDRVRREARGIADRSGGCRISTELRGGERVPLRFHLVGRTRH